MTELKDLQKVNELAKHLKNHGLAISDRDALRMAEDILGSKAKPIYPDIKPSQLQPTQEVAKEVAENIPDEAADEIFPDEEIATPIEGDDSTAGKYDYVDEGVNDKPDDYELPLEDVKTDTDKQVFDEEEIKKVSPEVYDVDNVVSDDAELIDEKDAPDVLVANEDALDSEVPPAVVEEEIVEEPNKESAESSGTEDMIESRAAEEEIENPEERNNAEEANTISEDAPEETTDADVAEKADAEDAPEEISSSAEAPKLDLLKEPSESDSSDKEEKEKDDSKKVGFDDIFG